MASTFSTLLMVACAAPEPFHGIGLAPQRDGASDGSGGPGDSGGTVGGGGIIGSGGIIGTGGAIGGPGGAPGTGGRPSTGGSTSTGGAGTTGGRSGTGGATAATGGAPASTGGAAGSASSSGEVFRDDFETFNSSRWTTTSGGGDWSVVTDGTQVFREGASLSSTTRLAWAGSSAFTNMTVEARVKVLAFAGQSTSYQVEVGARFQDATTFYYAALDSTGKVAIKKNSPGSSNMTLGSMDEGIATNSWYTVKFQAQGSTLSLSLNGIVKITVTDTEITSGGFALGTRNARAEFDDVRVTVP